MGANSTPPVAEVWFDLVGVGGLVLVRLGATGIPPVTEVWFDLVGVGGFVPVHGANGIPPAARVWFDPAGVAGFVLVQTGVNPCTVLSLSLCVLGEI